MAPIQLNDLQPGEPIFQFIETTLVIVDIDKYIGINDLKICRTSSGFLRRNRTTVLFSVTYVRNEIRNSTIRSLENLQKNLKYVELEFVPLGQVTVTQCGHKPPPISPIDGGATCPLLGAGIMPSMAYLAKSGIAGG